MARAEIGPRRQRRGPTLVLGRGAGTKVVHSSEAARLHRVHSFLRLVDENEARGVSRGQEQETPPRVVRPSIIGRGGSSIRTSNLGVTANDPAADGRTASAMRPASLGPPDGTPRPLSTLLQRCCATTL
ncbi:hypothetical protein MRX96_005262 [Rhipicephalus microplus]